MKRNNYFFVKVLSIFSFLFFLTLERNLEAGVLKKDNQKSTFNLDNDNIKKDGSTATVVCKSVSAKEIKLPNDILCESDEKRVMASPALKTFCDLNVNCVRNEFVWEKTSDDENDVASAAVHLNSKGRSVVSEKTSLRLLCAMPSDGNCKGLNSDQLIACAKDKMTVETVETVEKDK